MFDFVRNNKRVLQFVLVLLIFPSFVFFGVQGYDMTGTKNPTVAKVDGSPITQIEWDQAHQRQIEQMRRQRPELDAKFFDTPEAKQRTLDALVRERVTLTAVAKLHISVSDARVRDAFLKDPEYAFLRNTDGTVNKDLLAAQRLSSEQFTEQLRREISSRQVYAGVDASVLTAQTPRKLAFDALLERREVQWQLFDMRTHLGQIKPTDAQIDAYYQDPANATQFRSPEQAAIEYVVLDSVGLMRSISVSDEDLRKYYDENIARYTKAEERRASHILITSDKGAPAADKAKAKARADGLLAELRKAPATFAAMAKKHSQDPGSAERGGDLDFFARGAMVKAFEDAAFAMKVGEISNVVESDFGFHIIRLDATRGGERKPFDAVRAEIDKEVRSQLAQRRYAEVAEQFSNTVFEQPDSLQPVIDKFKLDKQTAVVQRTAQPGAAGPLASAKLLEAVFAGEVLRDKRNTSAIEFGSSQMVSARVVKYSPQRQLPLDEVRAGVVEKVKVQLAFAKAKTEGEERLAQLQKGGSTAGLSTPTLVSRARTQGMPGPVIDAVLRANTAKLPEVIGVPLGDQAYAVVRINKVDTPEDLGPQGDGLNKRYTQLWGDVESRAYYEALKARFKVEIIAKPVAAETKP